MRECLPIESHINQMRKRDDENNGAEIDREDANLVTEQSLEQQRQQDRIRAGEDHSQKNPQRPEQNRHG